MAEATFRHGNPLMVDYTPGGAVAAGAVVVVGDVTRIAHVDIAANKLGALAAGGGVYEMPKATGGGSAIAAGTKVYWDDAANVITTNAAAGANKVVGVTVAASADADATQLVQHIPLA